MSTPPARQRSTSLSRAKVPNAAAKPQVPKSTPAKVVSVEDRAAPKSETKTAAQSKKAVAAKSKALPKAKLVRDSFTMPQADFNLIAVLKAKALEFKRPTKKSELFRAGLQVLQALPEEQFKACLEGLPPIKTGRPKKG